MWPFTRSKAAIDRDLAQNRANIEELGRIFQRQQSGEMSEDEKQAAIQRLRDMRR